MTTYGPRCNVHPDRYGPVKTFGPNRLIVLHTSEGGETTGSAEALCSFMEMPGDRIDPTDGSRFGASYQAVFDTDRVLPAVRDEVVAYAAAGANSDGVHGCFPGKAGQTRAQWLDANSSAMMRQCADWMCDESVKLGIPLVRLADAEIAGGKWGYCDHHAINRVYRRTDHTDVGNDFPWDVLAALLIPTPPALEVPPMATLARSVRILDTRPDPKTARPDSRVGAQETRRVGVLAPPAWAGAAIVDIGVAEPNGPGFITAWSGQGDRPNTSVQDFDPWTPASNLWHVPLSQGADGGWGFSVYAHVSTHLIVDLVGWDSVI